MPAITVGVEVAVVLVLPHMASDQAKKAFLGWAMDSQCYRHVALTDGGNIQSLMNVLHGGMMDSGWVNPARAQATGDLINAVMRLAAMTVDRGWDLHALQAVLNTQAELAFVHGVYPNQLSLFDKTSQQAMTLPDPFMNRDEMASLTLAVASDVVTGYSAQRMRLFDRLPRAYWQLSNQEVCILLDLKPVELNAWDNARVFDRGLSSDQLQRITHALSLFACLYSIWGDKRGAGEWMRAPNHAPFLGGMTALAYLLDEQGHQKAWRDVVGWVAQAV